MELIHPLFLYLSILLKLRDSTTLKNAQDLDRSNRMKDLAKGIKDPDELAQHRRRENKKHVEQSVDERQKVFIVSYPRF